jgi:hypothetical protein
MSYFEDFKDYYFEMYNSNSSNKEKKPPYLWTTKGGGVIDLRYYNNLEHLINIKKYLENKVEIIQTYNHINNRIKKLTK